MEMSAIRGKGGVVWRLLANVMIFPFLDLEPLPYGVDHNPKSLVVLFLLHMMIILITIPWLMINEHDFMVIIMVITFKMLLLVIMTMTTMMI